MPTNWRSLLCLLKLKFARAKVNEKYSAHLEIFIAIKCEMFIKSLRYALSKWLHDNYFNVTVKRVFGFLNASASRSNGCKFLLTVTLTVLTFCSYRLTGRLTLLTVCSYRLTDRLTLLTVCSYRLTSRLTPLTFSRKRSNG